MLFHGTESTFQQSQRCVAAYSTVRCLVARSHARRVCRIMFTPAQSCSVGDVLVVKGIKVDVGNVNKLQNVLLWIRHVAFFLCLVLRAIKVHRVGDNQNGD